MRRVVIVGGPRTGKTTLALSMPGPRRHTDDLIGQLLWSDVSQAVADWFDKPGPWVVEGVATVRALRKWLRANEQGKPCDYLIGMWRQKVPLTDGQQRMFKGCQTVWNEIADEIRQRGVFVEER